MRPRIQLLLGDTAGVGPEIAVRVCADLPAQCAGVQVILTGDKRVLDEAERITGVTMDIPAVTSFEQIEARNDPVLFWDFRSVDAPSIPRSRVSVTAGKEILASLMQSIELAQAGRIDGFVFAPFNKESMHMAGSTQYSELEILKEAFDRPDITGEFNILDDLWIGRVTSHMPVSDIAKHITSERVGRTIELLGRAQVQAHIVPHLAVAALNPHAGEHGIFGDEEGTSILPAVETVRAAHPDWGIKGPLPADTLFPRVRKGGFTGVVGMYHDQIQIATKLIGLERGVTLLPGLPIPIATAAHGTAFDIAGKGLANHQALKNAVAIVAAMVTGTSENLSGASISTSGVAHVHGIEHIGLLVSNVDAMREWYQKAFGAVERSRSADASPIVFLQIGESSLLELIPRMDLESFPSDKVHICIAVDDFPWAIESAQNAGAQLDGPPSRAFDGSDIVFLRDPEGNSVQIVQRVTGSPIHGAAFGQKKT